MFRDDWVSYGFENGRHSPFVIDYGLAVTVEEEPSLEASQSLARELYDQHGAVTLVVSGGVDSQAMAYAFKTSGVPFRCVTFRYTEGINDHDIDGSFYNTHDIPVEVRDFDVVNFHDTELFDWAARYDSHSPHILTHMKIISSIDDGSTVVSSGCLVTTNGVIGAMNYSVFGLERYSRISGQPVVGFFFNYCPRVLRSFASSPTARTMRGEIHPDYYASKCAIYQESGYPVIPQIKKQHGFEMLKDKYDANPVPFRNRIQYKSRPSARPYDLIYRYPLYRVADYSELMITRYRPYG